MDISFETAKGLIEASLPENRQITVKLRKESYSLCLWSPDLAEVSELFFIKRSDLRKFSKYIKTSNHFCHTGLQGMYQNY